MDGRGGGHFIRYYCSAICVTQYRLDFSNMLLLFRFDKKDHTYLLTAAAVLSASKKP